jgi:long-chain acyl-CoA synthetase
MTTEPARVEVVTAQAAEDRQQRMAGSLRAAGLGPGDRVAICLPSSAALLCAVLGALRTGVVPVLLNATLLEAERDALVDDADPSLVITEADHLADLESGAPVELAPYPLARPMHYTSGTTGRSKGVWTGVWDAATAEAAFADEADLWSFGPDDVHLVCSPMYHSVSIRFAGGTLLRGGSCVVLTRFDADLAAAALVGGHGPVPTTTVMAPAALGRLALKWAVLDRVGPGVLWEFYGSTEGQFTACPPDEWVAHPGTVGRARPGRTLSTDADGTIWCRPPPFARFSYWRDEAKTAAAWRDGAFTVGDLGRLEDGYLFIDGRRDDLIITGGVNVYPAEVEARLAEEAGVADVAVFGVPDDRWGQEVCAVVVPSEPLDAALGRTLLATVAAHAAATLAGYKRPKRYAVLEALPRTATGKVQRHRLADMAGLDLIVP